MKVVLGRSFVHPSYDLGLIGGGLSLVVLGYLMLQPESPAHLVLRQNLWLLVLVSNSAHFAGSTVRLYTKPGAFQDLPFVTMGLPLVALVVVAVGLMWPGPFGSNLQALYLTWSPYHYSGQAFGLAVMYCYRGGSLGEAEKRLMRVTAFVPFLYLFTTMPGAGLDWLLPPAMLSQPGAVQTRQWLGTALAGASMLLPLVVFGLSLRPGRSPLPLISFSALVANALWLTVLAGEPGLFGLVTVFHGLQYLAILSVFHVREQRQAGDGRSALSHGLRFYAMCLGLGYLLFQAWPWAFVTVGFGYAESVIVTVAVINIHHFVVDGFIWKLRRDRNYAVIRDTGDSAPAAA